MTTLVSVLLPVYNAEQFIEAALASILTQDYPAMEVIVINDGSTDRTGEILDRMATEDSRVRLVSRENRGLVASLNEGLDMAQGDLVARMDGDDIAYPGRISTQVKAFEANPDLCVVGMNADLLFPGNYVIRTEGSLMETDDIRTQNLFHPIFVHPTVMLNNKILKTEKLRYDPRFPRCEDADFWRRVLPTHQSMLLPEIGLAWRQSHASVRTMHFREQCIDAFGIYADLLNEAGVKRDLSIFSVLSAGEGMPTNAQLEDLKAALKEIALIRPKFQETDEAFEKGFDGLIANILEMAEAFSDLPAVIQAVNDAGFGEYVSKRYKLQSTITNYSSPKIASLVMKQMRSFSRRVKADRITDLVSLPSAVLECLPN